MKHNRFGLAPAGLVISLMVLFSLAFTIAPQANSQEVVPVDPLAGLPGQLGALGGIAALIPILVSLGKVFGLVKDGQSKDWVTGLNLLAMTGLFIAQLAGYSHLIPIIDTQAGVFAKLMTSLLLFAGQVGISSLTYQQLRGSLLGFSFNPQ